MKRYDERDIMFARMAYVPGSQEYTDYYERHPERKESDDAMRGMPSILGEGTATYDAVMGPFSDAGFEFLHDIKHLASRTPRSQKVEVEPEAMTRRIKNMATFMGAKLVGICEMKPEHYYSHRGRQGVYGDPVEDLHKYGIVFAVEMDRDMINRAPQMEEVMAVVKGYMDAAVLGMWLTYYVTGLGYDARNHMDGNYLVVAPRVAEDAGLGEIGRNGLLLTKDYGQRVRLGVVTTNLELIPDSEAEFGVKELCQICGKCAVTCPGKAISKGSIEGFEGRKGWKIKQEDCYVMWRRLGTDCGVCLSTCPLSQALPHDLIDNMKDSEEARVAILEYYKEHYGIRPYLRQPLEIMK